MKKLFTIVLGLFLCMGIAYADDTAPTVYESGEWRYILLEDGTAEIVSYHDNAQALSVPEVLDGYQVTAIGDEAFSRVYSLRLIHIPNTVTKLGAHIFMNTILEEIDISADHPTLAIIDGVLFEKNEKRLVCYPSAIISDSYHIPEGTVIIDDGAFRYCESLKSITIPDSVITVGKRAFSACRSLTSITIPDSVTSIGDYAFCACESLTSITIPDSVTSIGEDAFTNCTSLTSITLPNSITTVEDGVFGNCQSLTSVTLSDCVNAIGERAFSYCKSLTSITIPGNITTLKKGVFHDCESLASVAIPDGVTSIENDAFSYCESLTSIIIPDGVTSIGPWAFEGCSPKLTLVVSRGSYAEQYAIDRSLIYTYTDAPDWLRN